MRGDVQLNKSQYVNISSATSTSGITVNTSTSPTTSTPSNTTVTAITTMGNGMKVKFSGNIEGGR